MENLLEIARNARNGRQEIAERLSDEKRDEAINEILVLPNADFEKFYYELLGGDLDEHWDIFYQAIFNLQFYIGFRSKSGEVISKLWVYAYQSIEECEQREAFLNEILNEENRHFWDMQSSLPYFCKAIELPPLFASVWFHQLAERVKNDLAGGVFEAIEYYVTAHPSNALEIFDIYKEQFSNETIRRIGGLMLGLLRGALKKETQKIDSEMKSSEDEGTRICYYNSIFLSYKSGVITLEQLSIYLQNMLDDDSDEIHRIAFWTVEKCLIGKIKGFSEFGIQWFKDNCSSNISGNSKYHVISCVWHICGPKEAENGIDYKTANQIIASILPVPNEHLGTLDRLGFYIRSRIKNLTEYEDTIFSFVENGSENLICLFEHARFNHFKSELKQLDLTHLITKLVFSGNMEKCKLGFLFLECSKFTPYTAKTLFKIEDEKAFVTLKQLRKDRNYNQTIARKVQFLEPFFRHVCKDLQNDFIDEIVIQAVNYWKGCLKEIKRFGRSKLITSVIERAESYFENIKKAQNSPANSFSFPGYQEACFQAHRRMNAEIQKHAKEKSILRHLASEVHLIYGNTFSALIKETVGDATPMAHFEQSMELPRLELIDPEGMTIRRISNS